MKQRIAIVGAGGFAREVAWLIRDINAQTPRFDLKGFLVSDVGKLGTGDSQDQVVGDFDWLESHRDQIDALVFGIGSPAVKQRLSTELLNRFPDMDWPALIHPTVQFDPYSCQVGRGVVICASTVGTVNLAFGDFAMVNLMCTIGHESTIGACSVLNPTVNISGGVDIGEGVLIGTGAQVLQYLKVGLGATVGAGAVVVKDVPPGKTVVGIPAKPIN